MVDGVNGSTVFSKNISYGSSPYRSVRDNSTMAVWPISNQSGTGSSPVCRFVVLVN